MIADDLQCPKDSWVSAGKRKGTGQTVTRYMLSHYEINWKQKGRPEIVWKGNKNWAELQYINIFFIKEVNFIL